MTQFSLPISWSATMQFLLPISASAAKQFSLRFLDRQRRSVGC